jgi:hypothetical protein
MPTSGYIQWKFQNQISPIILTGGIAESQGGALPIVTLIQGSTDSPNTDSLNADGTTNEGGDPAIDGYFANFTVAPGGKLLSYLAGQYTFANQQVAANAVIQQPTNVSFIMKVPATADYGYSYKQSTLIALASSLQQHINLGGTFTAITPMNIFTYGLLLDLYDVGSSETNPQNELRWDFYFPLISVAAANTAMNGLMQKLSNGSTISGTPTWTPPGLPVNNPNSLLGTSVTPQTQLGGSGVPSQDLQ